MSYNRPMVLAIAMGLGVMLGGAASAQELAPTRGTPKVRPRFFDPFNVSSRFTLSPFGTFGTKLESPLVGSSGTTAFGGPIQPLQPIVEQEEEDEAPIMVTSSSILPPPYSPPVRSPFRPLPRPPFIP